MTLAYALCHLFATWSQLQKIEQSPKGVSANSSMLPKILVIKFNLNIQLLD